MAEAPERAATEAVVAGHICLDVIPALSEGDTAFAPGQTVDAGPAALATGGAVSNTGLALHQLGVSTRLVGKVADDLFGQAVRQIVERHGASLADGMVIAPGESTSYSVILSPPSADRMLFHSPGCNATFRASDVPDAALTDARLFHFGYPPLMENMWRDGGAELAALFRRAKALGVTTSLDLAMPAPQSAAARADWRAIIAATLPYVDVFIPSLSELLLLIERPTFDWLLTEAAGGSLLDRVRATLVGEMGAWLLELGTRMVALKLGHRGLYLRTAGEQALATMGRARPEHLDDWAEREYWFPCYATQVVGTTGAGDATIAGFLLGLLRGMKPEGALAAACAVGACSVEAPDAVSGVRSWHETSTRFTAGSPRLPAGITDSDEGRWRWDDHRSLFVGPADRDAR